MLTLDPKQQPIAVLEHQGFEPPFLAGLLFAALGVVPLSSTGPLTPERIVGLLMLGSASVVLVALGRPRTRARSLAGLAAHPARAEERGVALELDGYALPPTYRAVMVFADGVRRTLLERSEPAGVLEDAVVLSRELGVPLVAGWSIDDGTVDSLLRRSDHAHRFESDATITFDSPPFAGQRNAAWTTLWASAFVLVATILMSESARAKVTPSALSLVLPGLGAFVVLLLGIWLVGARGTLVLGPTSVTRRRFWFGLELGQADRVELAVAAAAVALPPGGSVGHLVVSNGKSLFAFPVRGGTPQARRLRAAFSPEAANRAAE
jgi:hypothetical protein